jgi:hypothetical protein
MPYLQDVNVSSISGNTPEEMITSLVRQLNEWAREISNEKIALIQRGEDGNVRIVQGVQDVNGTRVVGTVYYDNDNVPRIFIGLAPDDSRPGIWISKEGDDVIALLNE